jgi:hypothetical protein
MPGKHFYPYKKGVDITAWVLQILVCLIFVGISAALLVIIDGYSDDVQSAFRYVVYFFCSPTEMVSPAL